MTLIESPEPPPSFRQSRTKLWIRTGILGVFGILFGLALYRDFTSGVFRLSWALMAFVPCLAAGYWMSRFVPMQVHLTTEHITLSFDRIYFALILLLVITKALAQAVWGDVIMCVILGLMIGRLGGIGLRVRNLKLKHKFNSDQVDRKQQ